MRITHLGHACLLVEMADRRILIDPGAFAGDLSGVRDLDAVVVTHQHPDHLDVDRFPGLVDANPSAQVLCDPGSLDVLRDLGVEARGSTPEAFRDFLAAEIAKWKSVIDKANIPRQ